MFYIQNVFFASSGLQHVNSGSNSLTMNDYIIKIRTYYNKVEDAWQRKYAYLSLTWQTIVLPNRMFTLVFIYFYVHVGHRMVKYQESGNALHSDMVIDESSLKRKHINGDQQTPFKRKRSQGNAYTTVTQKLTRCAPTLVKQSSFTIQRNCKNV